MAGTKIIGMILAVLSIGFLVIGAPAAIGSPQASTGIALVIAPAAGLISGSILLVGGMLTETIAQRPGSTQD